MAQPQVILCDEAGTPGESCDRFEAHLSPGKLHLAFSVYLTNEDGSKMLIQRRSKRKKLWPLVWANSCCSHPFAGEEAVAAGERRVQEELGIKVSLKAMGTMVYQADDPGGRGSEHEYVTLLRGTLPETAQVILDPDEVAEWKWMTMEELKKDMAEHPSWYAPWFHLGLQKLNV